LNPEWKGRGTEVCRRLEKAQKGWGKLQGGCGRENPPGMGDKMENGRPCVIPFP